MQYLVAIFIAGAIVFFTFKYLLFNVRLNSVCFLLVVFLLTAAGMYLRKNNTLYLNINGVDFAPPHFSSGLFPAILIGINVIDCIRDIAVANKYYKPMSVGVDRLYVIKSMSILAIEVLCWFVFDRNLTGALIPRSVYWLIVYPVQRIKVVSQIKKKMESEDPLPWNIWCFSNIRQYCFYYGKIAKMFDSDEDLVCNADVVRSEAKTSSQKLDRASPKKFTERIAAVIDKEGRAKREEATELLQSTVVNRHKAYWSKAQYDMMTAKLEEIFRTKTGMYSVDTIRDFPELHDFELRRKNGATNDIQWSCYFIIKALQPLAKSGVIKAGDYSDDFLENHQYGNGIKSRNASDNPLLSLD